MDRNDLQRILQSLLKETVKSEDEAPGTGRATDRRAGGTNDGSAGPAEATLRVLLTTPAFAGAAGDTARQVSEAGSENSWTARLERLIEVSQTQARTIEDNTKALVESTLGRVAGVSAAMTSGTGGGIPGLSLLASPLVSLATGLAKWIGGESDETPSLVRYSWPQELHLDAGTVGPERELGAIDHDLEGRPRPIDTGSAPQVTVNVQAMDSRSFLDHSEDIARAVREAILNSHSLNEVLREL